MDRAEGERVAAPGSFTGFIGLLDRVWISSFRSEVQANG